MRMIPPHSPIFEELSNNPDNHKYSFLSENRKYKNTKGYLTDLLERD